MTAPNFDYKQQLDPTAFSAALQRKSQMEFEMKSADQREKDARFGKILEAVQSGQQIAGNMMKQAQERSKVAGQEKVIAELGHKPLSVPYSPEAIATDATDSKTRLQQALMQANPDSYTKEMIQGQFPNAQGSQAKPWVQQSTFTTKGPDGKSRIVRGVQKLDGVYHPVTGEKVDDLNALPDAGFKVDVRTDPYSGDLMHIAGDGNTKKLTESTPAPADGIRDDYEMLRPYERKRLQKQQESFEASAVADQERKNIASLDQTESLLAAKNWIGDAAMGAFIARGIAKEVGNLNEYEQKRYNASPEIIRSIKTKLSKWTTGGITDEDRTDVQEVLRLSRAMAIDRLDRERETYFKKAIIKDFDPELGKNFIFDLETVRRPRIRPEQPSNQTTQTEKAVSDLGAALRKVLPKKR